MHRSCEIPFVSIIFSTGFVQADMAEPCEEIVEPVDKPVDWTHNFPIRKGDAP